MFCSNTDTYVEPLDSTRIHPETYDWARKMAVDALEYDDTAEDANPAGALEEILDNPDRLKDLDLDAFAVELERQVSTFVTVITWAQPDNSSCITADTIDVYYYDAAASDNYYDDDAAADDDDANANDCGVQGYGAKHITLYDIRAELSKRYKDLRTAYHSPTVEECFNLLTKETPETFYIGMSYNVLSCTQSSGLIMLSSQLWFFLNV